MYRLYYVTIYAWDRIVIKLGTITIIEPRVLFIVLLHTSIIYLLRASIVFPHVFQNRKCNFNIANDGGMAHSTLA